MAATASFSVTDACLRAHVNIIIFLWIRANYSFLKGRSLEAPGFPRGLEYHGHMPDRKRPEAIYRGIDRFPCI